MAIRHYKTARFLATPNLLDWAGVDLSGNHDNLSVFQRAIDESGGLLELPPNSLIVVDGTLKIPSFFHLQGMGGINETQLNQRKGPPKLWFTSNAGGVCFENQNPAAALSYSSLRDFSMMVDGTYDWMFDLKECVDVHLANIRMQSTQDSCGGIRSQKLVVTNSSWVNSTKGCQIRVTDAAVNAALDVDWGDGHIIGNSFTGGQGSHIRGTGGMCLTGNRFDRTVITACAALTIHKANEAQNWHSIVGNQIDEFYYGIQIEGHASDGLTNSDIRPVIEGNHFRCGHASGADIRLVNASGRVFKGPQIGVNSYSMYVPKLAIDDVTHWATISLPTITMRSRAAIGPVSYTTKTALETIAIPAFELGANGAMEIWTNWSFTGTNDTRFVYADFGGTTFQGVGPIGATSLSLPLRTEIRNMNNAAVQKGIQSNNYGTGAGTVAPVSGTVNTNASQNLVFSAAVTNASDTATLNWWRVNIYPG